MKSYFGFYSEAARMVSRYIHIMRKGKMWEGVCEEGICMMCICTINLSYVWYLLYADTLQNKAM